MDEQIQIRECTTHAELADCVDLQRAVFALPEVELSPVRHFVVTRNAGGFVLGAFSGDALVGFVLSVPAFLRGERAFYSHMTAVRGDFQGAGVGARLKWAQRERALSEGVKFVKWTFEPGKARNAFFNLEKLGAVVTEYQRNFYGTDYSAAPDSDKRIGLDSDRLFAEWRLESEKVVELANGRKYVEDADPSESIQIPADWIALVENDPEQAKAELERIREEFEDSFAGKMLCRGFRRSDNSYLIYDE
ncbi:MAG TPA: GNAT family N-acetyltransferase [Pyrinomonadaceae bacterium]|nr:GNAT family N-acetyltransferase [Pyrinomonadaceae bacterium]